MKVFINQTTHKINIASNGNEINSSIELELLEFGQIAANEVLKNNHWQTISEAEKHTYERDYVFFHTDNSPAGSAYIGIFNVYLNGLSNNFVQPTELDWNVVHYLR